jgi:hypothetical protein
MNQFRFFIILKHSIHRASVFYIFILHWIIPQQVSHCMDKSVDIRNFLNITIEPRVLSELKLDANRLVGLFDHFTIQLNKMLKFINNKQYKTVHKFQIK